ncbi:MAG: cytochrome c oxidase subunit 4 [Actinomycetota bacterium]
MKNAARIFLGAGVFFLVLFVVYWTTTGYEPVGSTLLLVGSPACLLIGVYLWLQLRRGGELMEDQPGAPDADAAGPVVAVPAASLWPVGLAFGAGTFAAGLVLGPWLAAPGVIVLVMSVIGLALDGRDYPE